VPRLLAPRAPHPNRKLPASAAPTTLPDTPPLGNHFDKDATRHPVERRLVEAFGSALDSALPSDARRVLDVGCGEGRHMRQAATRWPDAVVVGVDIADPDWLARWHPRGSRVAMAEATALPFASGRFDLVLALEVLEHLTDPAAALAQIASVCQGVVVLSVPWEPLWRAGNLVRGRYVGHLGNTPGHLQHFTRRGFLRAVAVHFEIEAVRRPFPWTVVRARTR
jgi:2-polyprenyl-3-methyl-5-hydroxy-6-metoxy-1,4-benzoquinol methylase